MENETRNIEVEENEENGNTEVEENENTEVEKNEVTESIEDRLSAMFGEIKQGISDLRDLIGEIKAMRIESGAEVFEGTEINQIDDDPEPVSIDELDLTM